MRRRALLAVFAALLLVGAYGAYVFSYPKYPEVKGCVNPFAVVKPVRGVQENWSEVHVLFKLATSRDFLKLAKPWNVDYSHVKIVKHTIEYNGEKITMLAMGIPLKDKKHVIALYERCEWYPCSTNRDCAIRCCLTGGNGACTILCAISRTFCIACIAAACPLCVDHCSEIGTKCVPITPGP